MSGLLSGAVQLQQGARGGRAGGRDQTVAAGNDVVLQVEQDQYATGEGPCLDAATLGSCGQIEALDQDTPVEPALDARDDDEQTRLDLASQQAGLTHDQLWLRRSALGGTSQPLELEAAVHGVPHAPALPRRAGMSPRGRHGDGRALERDDAGTARDAESQRRDTVGDARDEASARGDLAASRRDISSTRRDRAAGGRDRSAVGQDVATQELDDDAVVRDQAADDRDDASDRRDATSDVGDHAAALRDASGHDRDDAGHDRDLAADLRDVQAARRDHQAALRDARALSRDRAADPDHGRERLVEVLGQAAADRGHALSDRQASAQERRIAELDRTAALSDRDAGLLDRASSGRDRGAGQEGRRSGAADREQSVHDRDSALTDRAAGAAGRSRAEQDRGTALSDRRAGRREREHADQDRDHASADREASARQRDESGRDRQIALHDRAAAADERALDALDALTGVYLRGPGLMELDRELARAERTGQPLSVAFVDVDGLKKTNDVLGHPAGDAVLRRVAGALLDGVRGSDLVLRYGGDEFVCVLVGTGPGRAATLAGRVHALLQGGDSGASASFGFSGYVRGDTSETMVQRADEDLYAGRARRQRPGGASGPVR